MSCNVALGFVLPLEKAFQRAPPSLRRFSFVASYVAVAAAGSMNVLFTRASEIRNGIKVTDQSGEVKRRHLFLRLLEAHVYFAVNSNPVF